MMRLYGNVTTRTSRCLWTLEELGAEYEHVPVDFAAGEHLTPGYLALNPLGKVPALVDDDFVLCESAAICTYIADKFPEKRLVPEPGSLDRALYNQWMCFVMAELEQPLWTIAKHKFALPAELRVPDMIEVGKTEFARPANVLAKALQGKRFLIADRFTVVDVMVANTLSWATKARVPLEHDVLKSYLREHTSRPAYQRVVEMGKG